MKTIIDFAAEFATAAHSNQKRKDGRDYIVHPTNTAKLVKFYKEGHSETNSLVAPAYLHDVLEDTSVTYYQLVDTFGYLIAGLVMELTSNPEMKAELGDKSKYLSYTLKHMTSWALVIKLCDRLDNISDLKGCDEKWILRYFKETAYILNYCARERELTKTHKQICRDIIARLWQIRIDYQFADQIPDWKLFKD